MEKALSGDIVAINFPFSDLTQTKKRPAIIIARAEGNDLIMCQITTRETNNSIEITPPDFVLGRLSTESFVRFDKIFTLEEKNISYNIGRLKKQKFIEIKEKLCKLIMNGQ